jgi:hypothetical protein
MERYLLAGKSDVAQFLGEGVGVGVVAPGSAIHSPFSSLS